MTTGRVAVVADRVLDGKTVVAGTAVLVEATKIVAVVPPCGVPDGWPVLRRAGATILPGLVDVHVHLCCDGSPGALDLLPERDEPTIDATMRAALAQHRAAGVTTVRDLGDRSYAVLDRRGPRRSSHLGCPRSSGPGRR